MDFVIAGVSESMLRVMLSKIENYIQSTLVISKSRDLKKQFEISVLRHIRFVVLRKKQFEQPNFTNDSII